MMISFRKTLILAFLLVSSTLKAQVSVQLSQKSYVKFSSTDALNLLITSGLDQSVSVMLEVQIARPNGEPVSIISTESFLLDPGASIMSPHVINIHEFKHMNRDFGIYEVSNGYLPSLDYTICVNVVCVDPNCDQTIFSELPEKKIIHCEDIINVNPTPLMLSSPSDETESENNRPNFSWIPPMPIGGDPNLNYLFTLTEMQDRQSPEAAIRRNRPLYQTRVPISNTLPFPGELEGLLVGHKYAWQVEAILGNSVIQSSEVWEYEVIEEEEVVQGMPYVRLKTTDYNIYNAVNDLKFVFTHEARPAQMKYSICDINGNRLDVDLDQIPLIYGENNIKIDLRPFGLEHRQSYLLRVSDNRGTVYELKFKYYFKKELK